MNINIELKKNFINAYNKMQNEYGEEMASINGFFCWSIKLHRLH